MTLTGGNGSIGAVVTADVAQLSHPPMLLFTVWPPPTPPGNTQCAGRGLLVASAMRSTSVTALHVGGHGRSLAESVDPDLTANGNLIG